MAMQRVSSGYTIIEVMIFLAVSAAIAGAAMNLISGKQSETDFNQKMRDTQSKIQDWLNDVSTGVTGGDPSQQSCYVLGNRPQVRAVAPPAGYSPSCTFLGKAIQFTDQNYSMAQAESLYAYSVFGCRITACNPSGPIPKNMDDANPDTPVGRGGETSLIETFNLSPARVKSVTSAPLAGSYLIGFMNTFNTEQNTATNGSEDLNVYEYNYTVQEAMAGPRLLQCLEDTGSCKVANPPGNPSPLTSYSACLTDGKHTAKLTITSSSGVGASTRLDYVAC
jgi:hypothetical protein